MLSGAFVPMCINGAAQLLARVHHFCCLLCKSGWASCRAGWPEGRILWCCARSVCVLASLWWQGLEDLPTDKSPAACKHSALYIISRRSYQAACDVQNSPFGTQIQCLWRRKEVDFEVWQLFWSCAGFRLVKYLQRWISKNRTGILFSDGWQTVEMKNSCRSDNRDFSLAKVLSFPTSPVLACPESWLCSPAESCTELP